MRRHPRFRPCLQGAVLESRLVLSSATTPLLAPLPTHFGNDGSALGQIRDQYVRQFEVSYNELASQLQTAATAAQANGDIATLKTQVSLDLQALNDDLTAMLSISPLSQNSLTPTIQDSITGTGANSLATQLGNLETSIAGGSSATDIQNQALAILNASLKSNAKLLVAFFSPSNPDRRSISAAHRHAPPLSLIHSSYQTQYQAAFTTFGQQYTAAAKTMLNVTDPSQIAANRPAFDSKVDGFLVELNSKLSAMNSISPRAQFSLTPDVTTRLIGGTDSLETQLLALPTPTDTAGTSAQAFQTQSTTLINQALTDVLNDLNSFFNHR